MSNRLPFLTVLLCVCLRLRTDAVTSPDLSSPIYPLPYYSEVSTCPCDITNHKCDVYCCCDKVIIIFIRYYEDLKKLVNNNYKIYNSWTCYYLFVGVYVLIVKLSEMLIETISSSSFKLRVCYW
jgi:hypothetical protein